MSVDLEQALKIAKRAVEAASKVALPYFERGFELGDGVQTKADRSPVTAADQESETAIINIITSAFPDHAVLGEEGGARNPKGATSPPTARWIIDPIDGTRGFTRGGTFWGPLVALELDGEIAVGAIAMPARNISYWAARGLGCYRGPLGAAGTRLKISSISDWREATLSVGELGPMLHSAHGDRINHLIKTAASTRCYGDLAGAAQVLEGKAEVWVEGGVQIWDIAPFSVLIEEAGGRFTNFDGNRDLSLGQAVISNGHVHEHVLNALKR